MPESEDESEDESEGYLSANEGTNVAELSNTVDDLVDADEGTNVAELSKTVDDLVAAVSRLQAVSVTEKDHKAEVDKLSKTVDDLAATVSELKTLPAAEKETEVDELSKTVDELTVAVNKLQAVSVEEKGLFAQAKEKLLGAATDHTKHDLNEAVNAQLVTQLAKKLPPLVFGEVQKFAQSRIDLRKEEDKYRVKLALASTEINETQLTAKTLLDDIKGKGKKLEEHVKTLLDDIKGKGKKLEEHVKTIAINAKSIERKGEKLEKHVKTITSNTESIESLKKTITINTESIESLKKKLTDITRDPTFIENGLKTLKNVGALGLAAAAGAGVVGIAGSVATVGTAVGSAVATTGGTVAAMTSIGRSVVNTMCEAVAGDKSAVQHAENVVVQQTHADAVALDNLRARNDYLTEAIREQQLFGQLEFASRANQPQALPTQPNFTPRVPATRVPATRVPATRVSDTTNLRFNRGAVSKPKRRFDPNTIFN